MAVSPSSSLSSYSSLSPPQSIDLTPSHKRTASTAFEDRDNDYPYKIDHDEDDENNDDDATEDAVHSRNMSPALSNISSDTSGSAPGTPREDDEHGEQVTVCQWEGCRLDLGNMDDLVKHIHDEHIGTRRAKYACEWVGCVRKDMPHASGYALRAHMRSHTREKPFYCTLPECDRSFTRSDALAKHMRTVHETEALRPSDPIPRSHPNHPLQLSAHAYESIIYPRNGSQSPTYLRPNDDSNDNSIYGDSSVDNSTTYYQPRDGFDADEARLPPKQLHRLLKQKLLWAEKEKTELEKEKVELEETRRQAWVKKELMLEKLMLYDVGLEIAQEYMAEPFEV